MGTTIIQAKHCNGFNRSFSESDFFNPDSPNSVIEKEIPRIKKLRENKLLDHYMLFSNRRLAGNAETDIRKHISGSCNIPEASIYLCGVEQLELWLKRFPGVSKLADLDPVDSPLIVSPEELAEIVQALARHKGSISAVLRNPPTPRVPYEKKNQINNMTKEYAREQRNRYLKETKEIFTFLSAPENQELQNMYESVVEEFQLKIITKRKNHQNFDAVMEYLVDLLFNRDPILRQRSHKKLVRAILFYMYWNCDIGETEDAQAV